MTAIAEPSGNEPVHLYCCDKNRSLCGDDISDELEVTGKPTEEQCGNCVGRLHLPCGLPGCQFGRVS